MLPFIVLGLSAGFTQHRPLLRGGGRGGGGQRFPSFFHRHYAAVHTELPGGAVIVFLWPFTDWLTPMILGQVDFLPSVAYINIAYHFTDMHRKTMGIVAVVVSSLVCISLFLLARWWVERKSYTGLSKGTTAEGRVIEPSLLVKGGSYFYMLFIPAWSCSCRSCWAWRRFPGAGFRALSSYWTLDNFRVILNESPLLIQNSFLYSGVALVFGIAFGLPAAYVIVRTRLPARTPWTFVITLMLAFPAWPWG